MTLLEIAQQEPFRFLMAIKMAELDLAPMTMLVLGYTLQEYLDATSLRAIAEQRRNG